MEDKKIKELETGSLQVIDQSRTYIVKDNDSYLSASNFLKKIKAMAKEVKNTFNPIVEKLNAAHKEATGQRKRHLDPLIAAEKELKDKLIEYTNEQEAIRQAEEDRLRKIQEDKEEKLRQKAEAERLKQEEIDRQLQEVEDEEERARLEKEKAKSINKEIKAEGKADDAASVVPQVKTAMPIAEGQTYITVYEFTIEDKNLVPDMYKIVDVKAIGAVVKALKDNTNIAGVKVTTKKQLRQKS